jgi:uncharacterized glyoxalase superfamily protein PhnB
MMLMQGGTSHSAWSDVGIVEPVDERDDSRPIAILKVVDVDRTIEWYEAAGFALQGRVVGDQTDWCELGRDGTVIQFLAGETPWNGAPGLTGCLYVHVDDIHAVFSGLRAPVTWEWGVEDREWGAREIVLQDPDGYIVTLTQQVDSEQET